MGFVERAFTPPGTGGAEAQAIMAQAAARDAAAQAAARAAVPTAPAPPTMPTAPAPPPQFSPGATPSAKQRAAVGTSTMLGAAAAGGQTARKTLLGQ